MTATAFVFPGQGSQTPGMVTDFYEAWPRVASTVDDFDDGLTELLLEADAERLRDPAHTQQAVLATSVAVERAVRERAGIEPTVTAGHSLGHISAATVAGAIPFADAVSLVSERGRLMADAEETAGPGTMVAVSLAPADAVADAVAKFETVSVAGYNSPKQTVISGPSDAVADATAAIEDRFDRVRTTELDVGSAFHSTVMGPAVEPFETVLSETSLEAPSTPIVSDVTGERYRDAETLRSHLGRQLTSPIRWTDVVETLVAQGVDRVIEFPPAGTLTTLTERTTRDLDVVALDDPATLEEVTAN